MSQKYSHFEREQIIWASPLPKDEKFLLLALNSFIGADGKCFPGNKRLAQMMSVSVQSIKRYLAQMEAKGIITRTRQHRPNGSETSSEKQVDFDAIKATHQPSDDGGGGITDETGGVSPVSQGGITDETGGVSPVSHPELSKRTIQKELRKRTTTNPQSGGGCDFSPPSDSDGLGSNAQECAEIAVELLSMHLKVAPTKSLVSACQGKSSAAATLNALAVLERHLDGHPIKSPQGMLTRALQQNWAPSHSIFTEGRLQKPGLRLYVEQYAIAAQKLGYITGLSFQRDEYFYTDHTGQPYRAPYEYLPLLPGGENTLQNLWAELQLQQVA